MNDSTEKLLVVAAGMAVGALGYLAVKDREELHKLLDLVLDKGKDLMDSDEHGLQDLLARFTKKDD